jgi:hypothetical protein
VLGIGGSLTVMSSSIAPPRATAAPLGILLDYAAGVIKAADIKASGAHGAIRYVSDRRPVGHGCLASPLSWRRRVTCIRAV